MRAAASRRMWARRLIRAGDAVAPVVTAPVRAFRHVFYENGIFQPANLYCVATAGAVVTALCMMFHDIATAGLPAAPDDVREAMATSPCVSRLLVDTQTNYVQPLTNADLDTAEARCERTSREAAAKAEQVRAMGLR